jgi:hypothetical protein
MVNLLGVLVAFAWWIGWSLVGVWLDLRGGLLIV